MVEVNEEAKRPKITRGSQLMYRRFLAVRCLDKFIGKPDEVGIEVFFSASAPVPSAWNISAAWPLNMLCKRPHSLRWQETSKGFNGFQGFKVGSK